jgi:hypothetical protein
VETNIGIKFSSKIVTTITEYFWQFNAMYELSAFRGTGESEDDVINADVRNSNYELKTETDNAPRPDVAVRDSLDVNVTWLFRQLQQAQQPLVWPVHTRFTIDRLAASCHTPRRNADVDAALSCFNAVDVWCVQVERHFRTNIFPLQLHSNQSGKNQLDISCINADEIFVPVIPLLEDVGQRFAASASPAIGDGTGPGNVALLAAPSVVLGLPDANAFLREEKRGIDQKFAQLQETLPAAGAHNTLITSVQAQLIAILMHARKVAHAYRSGVDCIEAMLRSQLVAAIGKEVKPSDFAEYMRFHNTKLFAPQYRPKPFCFAVRRSEHHTPEGVLSIEETPPGSSSIAQPVLTHVSSLDAGVRTGCQRTGIMDFSLSASSRVRFRGARHLHGFLMHRFLSEGPAPVLHLRAEARQFSSYIVLMGCISSATSFDPKYAMIVQNKDDITVPLDLELIPSAKQFKEAISSLSPEQQRFAKAFRGMQLESSLFGVLVIQIKPLLEKVLNLPADSLTKEIRLTQDLMELFIKYQIPSDLLSYSPDSLGAGGEAEGVSVREKLGVVKGHVTAIQEMVRDCQEQEIADKKMETQYQSRSNSESVISSSDHSEGDDYEEGRGWGCDDDLCDSFEDACFEECDECEEEVAAPVPVPKKSTHKDKEKKSAPVPAKKVRLISID